MERQEAKNHCEVRDGKLYFTEGNGVIENLPGGGFIAAIRCGETTIVAVAVPGYHTFVDASYDRWFKNYWKILKFQSWPGCVLEELKHLVEELQPVSQADPDLIQKLFQGGDPGQEEENNQ